MADRTWAEVGELVREYRESRGWRQSDVVERVAGENLSLATYRNFERGLRESWRELTLSAIERAFGLSHRSLHRLKAGEDFERVLIEKRLDDLQQVSRDRRESREQMELEEVGRLSAEGQHAALENLLLQAFRTLDLPEKRRITKSAMMSAYLAGDEHFKTLQDEVAFLDSRQFAEAAEGGPTESEGPAQRRPSPDPEPDGP